MTGISKDKEASFYGRTFDFERCFWHRVTAANGAGELMPIFCDWDTNWMDAVDPARHGYRFERPTTLGYGGDACRFWFIRAARGGVKSGTREE